MSRHHLQQEAGTPRSFNQGFPHLLGKFLLDTQIGLLVAFGLFGAGLLLDALVIGGSMLAEGPPDFRFLYLVKTFLVSLGSLQFVFAISTFEAETLAKTGARGVERDNAKSGIFALSFLEPETRESFSPAVKRRLICSVILLSGLFLILFLYSPRLFSILCSEDYPIEWGSALLCFISSGIFMYGSLIVYRSSLQLKVWYLLGTLALGLTMFLIAMEEISWFQRVFTIETPEAFSTNVQDELNLHNFFSNQAENLYYFGSFVLLILLPFVNEKTALAKKIGTLGFFIPSRFILLTSSIFVAYNYEMWNSIFMQVSFFVTFFILLYYSFSEQRTGELFSLPILLLGMLTFTQLIFLFSGHHLVREWDLTEYKEFFIPLSFFLYSLEILFRNKQLCFTTNTLIN